MRYLITGGAGFIGCNFIRYLLEKYPDAEIINLDKLTYAANPASVSGLERHRLVHGDICDEKLVNKLAGQSDIIVNFAAESHVDRSIQDASAFVRTNVLGTHILLEAARRHRLRFHHISTDEVYGQLGKSGCFSESTPYSPRSPYAASKAAADHLVMAYFHTHGLQATISNSSNNYGPFQHPEKLIPLFITNLLTEKPVPLYGDGKNIRDWIHVRDHCRAIDKIIREGKPGWTYCVGARCELPNIELTKMILSELGRDESWIQKVRDRKGHDRRYAIDPSRVLALGWKPEVDFSSGLRQTIGWYKANRAWWMHFRNRAFEEFEAGK